MRVSSRDDNAEGRARHDSSNAVDWAKRATPPGSLISCCWRDSGWGLLRLAKSLAQTEELSATLSKTTAAAQASRTASEPIMSSSPSNVEMGATQKTGPAIPAAIFVANPAICFGDFVAQS